MKINVPKDCDNAPKRKIIRDFIIAWFKKEWSDIENIIEDEFQFRIVGKQTVENKKDLQKYLQNGVEVTTLTIDEVLSHGKFGACNGSVELNKQTIDFAYFFSFKSAGKNTVTKISEYKIPCKN
ncbi:hypothetical protein FAZ19_19405 [Sphingobacterium alkalisoli]|uniref:Nuclear transport factor 2 family protein n=2 Tax=Sphingobacterium alkalisoli TaxID=1874115 RepID=A0A4U0GUV6_9SPHI|nr:hypothetical protein FAZ19_19405 [Sphingobacterium alkalisoli]